jgi:hypothetical protein
METPNLEGELIHDGYECWGVVSRHPTEEEAQGYGNELSLFWITHWFRPGRGVYWNINSTTSVEWCIKNFREKMNLL